jgi:hypothetical protein
MSGLGPVAIGLLLVAGLPRLVWGSPSQRALATGLCSSAVVLALEVDAVQGPLAGLGAAAYAPLLQCLGVTLAAAAALAMVRQVSPMPLHPTVSPAVVGVPLALLQCLLYAASGVADEPATGRLFLDHTDRPAVVLLWLVTAAGPVAAGAFLLPLLRVHGPALALRRSRFAVACTFAGLVVVGFAGLAMGAQLLLRAAQWPGLGRMVAAATPLAPAGLALVAVGVLVVRAATALDPVVHWGRAHLALRRLDALARELVSAAPEWAVSSVENRWAVRNPGGQLYHRVIAIRDASWTLLGSLDGDVPLDRAAEFATARVGGGPGSAALAEACWLRYAVEVRARGERPAGPQPAQFPERLAEPPGSVDDEAGFLVAVARMWSTPMVEEFVDGLTADHSADRHSPLRTA